MSHWKCWESNKILLFLAFSMFSVFFSGLSLAAANCWSYTSSADCTNSLLHPTTTCNWNLGTTYSWCEEKGCWNYPNSTSCTTNNCTWNSQYSYCYKKGCSDNTNSSSCLSSNCKWDSWGYCTKQNCWDYKDSGSCGSTTDSLSCKWDSSYGYCSGPSDKSCWNYYDQVSCQAITGCSWTQGNCYELGCWNYYNQTDCTNTTLQVGQTCAWGSAGSSGCCKENATTNCYNLANKTTCKSTTGC